ncbi:hypothetical protein COR50_21420 [Chitinophaga caeni]|uniref:Uncharacterized protein n=1 Tax=Chitinophaga caeni TaxID=2029983 RepID=A0A291R040_9BACT|nr:hypothetical protein [Chitinophaga caeni]ATL49531.1 hypothetical protein COR50_21420 [Chitinophaga caeni]
MKPLKYSLSVFGLGLLIHSICTSIGYYLVVTYIKSELVLNTHQVYLDLLKYSLIQNFINYSIIAILNYTIIIIFYRKLEVKKIKSIVTVLPLIWLLYVLMKFGDEDQLNPLLVAVCIGIVSLMFLINFVKLAPRNSTMAASLEEEIQTINISNE